MGHYGRFGEFGEGGGWWLNWPTLIAIGLVVLLLVILLVALTRRSRTREDGSDVDPEVYENMDGQIRSMLYQNGGALTQDQIRDNLGVHVADMARVLNDMEERGEIRRVWIPREYTYGVELV